MSPAANAASSSSESQADSYLDLTRSQSDSLSHETSVAENEDMTYVNVEDRGVIYDATQQVPESRVAFFTGLYRLRSGVWLCGFQVGTGKHSPDSTIQLCRSDDGGTTWTRLAPNLATWVEGVPGSLSAPAIV